MIRIVAGEEFYGFHALRTGDFHGGGIGDRAGCIGGSVRAVGAGAQYRYAGCSLESNRGSQYELLIPAA